MTEAVAERLLELISSGKLKPGDKLPPERELAEHLNVGRTTVREALKLLTLTGLLEAKRGQGTFVGREFGESMLEQIAWSILLSERAFEQLFEVRWALEVLAARLAAERATPEEKEAIGAHCELLKADAEDVEHMVKIDLAFHQAIAKASHNQLLERLMLSLHGFLESYIRQSIRATESPESTYQEHDAICTAIAAADPQRAKQAMETHLAISFDLVLAAIKQTDVGMTSANHDSDLIR